MAGILITKRPLKQVLYLYTLRCVAAPFAVGLVVLLLSLSLERFLRILDIIAGSGAPASYAVLLLFYLVPHYLSLALPAAFFLSSLLAFRNLYDRSELAVIQSAGISPRDLLYPLTMLSFILAGFLVVLSGYIDPVARYDYRAEIYRLSASQQIFNLKPGLFTKLDRNMTVKAETISPDGGSLEKVFITDTRIAATTTYISAATADLDRDEASGQVTLYLRHGTLIRYLSYEPLRILAFETYPLKMTRPDEGAFGPRGKDEREMTLNELVTGGIPYVFGKSTTAERMSEFHGRLVQAGSLPFLAMLALPLALLGNGRTGRSYGLVVGIAVIVLYDKILGFGGIAAAKGHLSPWVAQWLPLGGLGLASWLALWWQTPVYLGSLKARLSGRTKESGS